VPPRAQEAFTNVAVDEVAPGSGAFLIASIDGVDVGCGAVRDIGDRTGELKRMFVLPDHRGLGIASALVAALEREASKLGLVRIVLEVATFSDDAIAMYAKNGYAQIPLFGPYIDSPISIAMSKALESSR
jgi:putative acetyltransferase